ncbi:flagellar motor protein MotB [Paenibacillus hexagrammi]|uniref:flagellar motor protein MotB n=1 Tax=Paenibacillus hexagrammi TaxID=2908839 RepID=UPI002882F632|nr:flagellar motor protein MotB [Paenibacillus sp. YPD9-1]
MSKKKHEEHEEHVDETWLIPYADLLTLLLALFIILFASSQMDSKKYDSIMRSLNSAFTGGTAPLEMFNLIPIDEAANSTKNNNDNQNPPPTKKEDQNAGKLTEKQKKEEEDLEKLKKSVDAFIKDNNLAEQLTTKLDNEKLVITISDKALFDSGSASLKQDAKTLAVPMSELLSSYPDYQVEVSGHTDNIPIHNQEFETNWDLSAKRSVNFMKELLNNSKLNPVMYRSVGYGEFHPVESNDTADGRARNRRVEVSILRNLKPSEDNSGADQGGAANAGQAGSDAQQQAQTSGEGQAQTQAQAQTPAEVQTQAQLPTESQPQAQSSVEDQPQAEQQSQT